MISVTLSCQNADGFVADGLCRKGDNNEMLICKELVQNSALHLNRK